jgi:hypothetical protein
MLGSNPSADSVASTDRQGDASASPCHLRRGTYRERQQSAKSWGCGGKAPAACSAPKLPSETGAPSDNA